MVKKRGGTRDAERRNDARHHPGEHARKLTTGEPDAWKLARPVRRGADGKGRSRLPVTADANGPTKPDASRTSPAAYLRRSRPERAARDGAAHQSQRGGSGALASMTTAGLGDLGEEGKQPTTRRRVHAVSLIQEGCLRFDPLLYPPKQICQ